MDLTHSAADAVKEILGRFPDIDDADHACLRDALADSGDEMTADLIGDAEWTVFRGEIRPADQLAESLRWSLRCLADGIAGTFRRERTAIALEFTKTKLWAHAVGHVSHVFDLVAAEPFRTNDAIHAETALDCCSHLADDDLWVNREPGFPDAGLRLTLGRAGASVLWPTPGVPAPPPVSYHLPIGGVNAVVSWNADGWKVGGLEVSSPASCARVFGDDVEGFLSYYDL